MASKGVRLCTCAAEAVLARTLRRATSNQLKGHVGRTSIASTWKVRNGFTHMDTHTHTTHTHMQSFSTSASLASSEMPSRGMPFTTKLASASTPHTTDSLIPCYHVLNNEGKVLDPSQDPQVFITHKREGTNNIMMCVDLSMVLLTANFSCIWKFHIVWTFHGSIEYHSLSSCKRSPLLLLENAIIVFHD